ncbi:unnamed protein product [Closterium sp. NIES-54]
MLRASAQGMVVLKAHDANTHITLNDVPIVQKLRFNLPMASQLTDCGMQLSTNPETRNIVLHYASPDKPRKLLGRAHADNNAYVLDLDITDCTSDTDEFYRPHPAPLRAHHPDGGPWVPHHPHPREAALHDPNRDCICQDCHMATASTNANVTGRGLAAIAKAERYAPPDEALGANKAEKASPMKGGGEATTVGKPVAAEPGAIPKTHVQPHAEIGVTATGGTGGGWGGSNEVQRDTCASGMHANDDLWHPSLGHRSSQTFNNCITAKVFAPGAILRPDDSEITTTAQPRSCTVFPKAALTHQPFSSLDSGTVRYEKLEKVYIDFLVIGHCVLNGGSYTLTFVDVGTRYVWVANV